MVCGLRAELISATRPRYRSRSISHSNLAVAAQGRWEHALKLLEQAQQLADRSHEASPLKVNARHLPRHLCSPKASQPFLVALHGAVGVLAEALLWEQAGAPGIFKAVPGGNAHDSWPTASRRFNCCRGCRRPQNCLAKQQTLQVIVLSMLPVPLRGST